MEYLVRVLILHDVQARPNVGGARTLGDELKREFLIFHLDAVGTLVLLVSILDDSLLGAGCLTRAELLIFGTSTLAVLLVLADIAIPLHLHQVECTIQTTFHFGISKSWPASSTFVTVSLVALVCCQLGSRLLIVGFQILGE